MTKIPKAYTSAKRNLSSSIFSSSHNNHKLLSSQMRMIEKYQLSLSNVHFEDEKYISTTCKPHPVYNGLGTYNIVLKLQEE